MRYKKLLWTLLTISIVSAVVWFQGRPLFDSGLVDPSKGLVFYDFVIFRDSLVHLSLINEIGNRFPPTNFAASGESLKNYHYLFDAGITVILKIVPIGLLDFYFRVMPVLLSTLLCAAIYLTTLKLTKSRFFASLSIFFTVFATSFGSLVPHIKVLLSARSVTGGNNMFMTDQISNMLINPQGVFALVIFLTLFLLLESYSKKQQIWTLVAYSLILGVSFGIKAYGGIVFASAGLLFSAYYLFIKRDFRPLVATFCGVALISVWFLYTIDRKVAGINWAPFWLLDVMYNDLDRLNEPALPFVKSVYISLDAWHHVARLTVEQFIAYFVGSLGLRLFGLVGLFYLLKNRVRQNPSWLFLIAGAAASFSVPLFFNQSSKAYDIVQFTPYFSLFMGLMFTYTLFLFSEKSPSKVLSVLVVGLFVALLLISNQREIIERLRPNRDEIIFSPHEVQALGYIKNSTPREAIFLLPISNFNDDYLWLPGLAGRRTFYSGSRFASQVGVDIEKKKVRIKNPDCNLKFDYIYAKKPEVKDFDRIISGCKVKVAFENEEVIIFHHNN